MTDTSLRMNRKMLEMIRCRSGEERLKMGADMFDMAKKIVLASKTGHPCNDPETRSYLFLRFYGSEFIGERKERILRYLMQSFGA